jgi:multidrug efflux pump subunit AcrA (membrane-fusion protein)
VQQQRALRAAEASYEKAKASLAHAEAGRTRAEASLARWQSEQERTRQLITNRTIAPSAADEVRDQLKSAEAAREECDAAIKLAEAARDESAALRDQAAANVQVAEARVKMAEADRQHSAAVLEYAQIRAPFDGVVTTRPVDTGHFVQPSGSGTAGSGPLFIVVRTDPVRIFVDVPESDAVEVHAGTPARIRVQALRDEEFVGKVTRFSWVLDTQTRTLRTQIDLPNAEGRLRPGMYASAFLAVERPGTWTLPASAVFVQDDQTTVVCAVGGKAHRVPVKVGVRQDGRIEVLRQRPQGVHGTRPAPWENFTGREEIVLRNGAALSEGQEIRSQPLR